MTSPIFMGKVKENPWKIQWKIPNLSEGRLERSWKHPRFQVGNDRKLLGWVKHGETELDQVLDDAWTMLNSSWYRHSDHPPQGKRWTKVHQALRTAAVTPRFLMTGSGHRPWIDFAPEENMLLAVFDLWPQKNMTYIFPQNNSWGVPLSDQTHLRPHKS